MRKLAVGECLKVVIAILWSPSQGVIRPGKWASGEELQATCLFQKCHRMAQS